MVNPPAPYMDEFAFKMQTGNRTVDAEHEFTPGGSVITNRPHFAVLGADEKVKLAFVDQRDGTDATRGQREFSDRLQARKRYDEHLAAGSTNRCSINGPHRTAQGEQDGWQSIEMEALCTAFKRFPGNQTVIHGEKCAFLCG